MTRPLDRGAAIPLAWQLSHRSGPACPAARHASSYGRSGRLCETRAPWPEGFCKQGPCRFGRSAAVRGGITGDGGGAGRRRDVLVYRNPPAGSRLPRSWSVRRTTLACAARSVTASSSRLSPLRDHAACGTCGSGRTASRLCVSPSPPSARTEHRSPHQPGRVTSARNHSDTISQPNRYLH